jgi:hypothetical protein
MNNFDKNWRNAKLSIFRLEGRAEYRNPGTQENIAQWKLGKLDLGNDKIWRAWMGTPLKIRTRKIPIRRVRVVPMPLPDYIKFEIALWQKNSAKNGEEIFFIDTDSYQKIIAGMGFNPKDFWLFDDEQLLIFNYDRSGQFSGDILIGDRGMVKRYADLKAKLLELSSPLRTFAAKM